MSIHLDLVAILFVVCGALTAVIGASMLALGIGAFALLSSAGRAGSGAQFAGELAAGVFTGLAVMALMWGVAHIAIGLPLRQRRHWSRLAALIVGSVDLLLLPYGTALGCYALAILLRDDAKRLFEVRA